MKINGERYMPYISNPWLGPHEPYISYEHWHRYCFAAPFVTGKSVLDIACGEGYGSDYLAERAAFVHGVDVSPDAVQHARQTYVRGNLLFLQGSAGAIPIPGQHCLDVIVSFETIEHLDASTQECFAREVKRLLKPEGVLLVSTPNRAIYGQAENNTKNPYHLREFNQPEFLQFLSGYFARVTLLSQRVYPTCYIWNPNAPSTTRSEHQFVLDDMRFRPHHGDGKEPIYMIAACSNGAVAPRAEDSVLIDLSEVAIRGVPGREQWHTSTLFWDSGFGFRAGELIQEQVAYGPKFTVCYDLDPSLLYRQLRWDPLEVRLCEVRLRRVRWQDGGGANHELDLGQASSNGQCLGEGAFRFETGDPMVYLPISGSVSGVVIEGECIVAGETPSFQGMEALLVRSRGKLQEAHEQLQAREQCLRECEQQLQECHRHLLERHQQLQEHQQQLQQYQSVRTLGPAFLRSLIRSTRRRMPDWLHKAG